MPDGLQVPGVGSALGKVKTDLAQLGTTYADLVRHSRSPRDKPTQPACNGVRLGLGLALNE